MVSVRCPDDIKVVMEIHPSAKIPKFFVTALEMTPLFFLSVHKLSVLFYDKPYPS